MCVHAVNKVSQKQRDEMRFSSKSTLVLRRGLLGNNHAINTGSFPAPPQVIEKQLGRGACDMLDTRPQEISTQTEELRQHVST